MIVLLREGAVPPAGVESGSTVKVLSSPPNDPVSNWGLDAIGASKAWQFQTGRPSVRISLLDTGGETVHPDLGGAIGSKLVGGYDFVHGDSNFHPDGAASGARTMGCPSPAGCHSVSDIQQWVIIGTRGRIGHECCACRCVGEACPICMMTSPE